VSPDQAVSQRRLDLLLLGQPVGAPDLRLPRPEHLLGRLRQQGRHTSREWPSASPATNTTYADATCSDSDDGSFHGCASTRTPICIEERPAQFT
jgi:hypothetical protein